MCVCGNVICGFLFVLFLPFLPSLLPSPTTEATNNQCIVSFFSIIIWRVICPWVKFVLDILTLCFGFIAFFVLEFFFSPFTHKQTHLHTYVLARCFSLPHSLYESCQWEERAIRKLVAEGKAAPRLKGHDSRSSKAELECPICFLYYEQLNTTKCCNAYICTECYLQVRPQKEKHSTCPYCNHPKLSIQIAGKLSQSQIQKETEEQLRIEQARRRADSVSKQQQEHGDENSDANSSSNASTNRGNNGGGFGASLEQDSRVALFRARSESYASAASSESTNNGEAEINLIQAIAMSPEERRRLENEMRNQNSHPLALQMEAEAEQRRMQHERAYNRNNYSSQDGRSGHLFGRSSRRRGRTMRLPNGSSSSGSSSRDWQRIVAALERGGGTTIPISGIEDLVALEAAIMNIDQERSNSSNQDDFHPVLRNFLAQLGQEGGEDDDGPSHSQSLHNLVRALNASRRRAGGIPVRSGFDGADAQNSSSSSNVFQDATLGTAAMLMRGISEEQQLAMAIAASLQESSNNNNSTPSNTESADNSSEGAGATVTNDEHVNTSESTAESTPQVGGGGDGEEEVGAAATTEEVVQESGQAVDTPGETLDTTAEEVVPEANEPTTNTSVEQPDATSSSGPALPTTEGTDD